MSTELLMSRDNLEDIMDRLKGCRALMEALHMVSEETVIPVATLGGMCDLLECICRDFEADIACAENQAEKEAVAV